jgi:hypothetical protein
VPVNSGLRFDGSTGYATLPATGFADFSNGFSAGVWVNPSSATDWQRIFDFGAGPDNNNIGLCRGQGNELRFYTYNGSAGSTLVASNAIELNKWQYFSVSMQTDGSAKIYKNGVEIASGSVYVPPNVTRANNYIAKSNWATALYAGQMAGLSVWNRGLSAGEMARAQTTAFAGTEPGLVGYWPMADVDHQLDGIVIGGITSASTFNAVAANLDFESPLLADGTVRGEESSPGNTGWSYTTTVFNGRTIYPTLVSTGSAYENRNAPSGKQAMLIRGTSAISRTISGFAAGQTYQL